MTGYTLPQIMALTYPQLLFLLEGQGPILYPRLKVSLDAAFANVSDEPDEKTKESPVQKIIREDGERREQRARGLEVKPTAKEEARGKAYRIVNAYYLGEVEAQAPAPRTTPPIPGLPLHTARAIVAYAEAGHFASEVWARDVVMYWPGILASAAAGAGVP